MKTEIEPVDVLAVGAHPDDVEINAGGFVLKLTAAGRRVGLLDLTRGEMGTRGTPEIRLAESSAAAGILGARFRANLDLGDSRLTDDIPTREIVAAAIRRARPTFCLVSWTESKHPDHSIAGRLVIEASWIAGLVNYEIEGLAPHRPSRVFFYPSRYEFEPKFIVDISDHWERKKEACLAFASQFHREGSDEPATEIARKGFIDQVEARARSYGRLIGARYGEPYTMAEGVALDDPFTLLDGDRF